MLKPENLCELLRQKGKKSILNSGQDLLVQEIWIQS